MIGVKKYSELSQSVKWKLETFIDIEFGDIPIVKQTQWAKPDWTIINHQSNKIRTFYNVVLREAEIDGKACMIGGLNNVITPKEFRGKGYATETIRKTQYLIFEEFKCELGILLCADELIPFYQRLNWYVVRCPVFFEQKHGRAIWQSNTMLLSNDEKNYPQVIDLKGLPW